MSRYIISLDPGKNTTKVMGIELTENMDLNKAKKDFFRTGTYDLANGYIDTEGNSHKVEFEGKSIIVGDQGEAKSYETSKTEFLHQVCSYTAITRFLKPKSKDNHISLVLACPITVLRAEASKQEYKSFLKGEDVIKIKVDDKDYEFVIDDIMVKAEGSGILSLTPDLFKGTKVGVVDFGGLNMTFTLFTNGVCAKPDSDRFAEEFGAIKLTNYVSNDLTAYRKGNIVDFRTSERALEVGHLLNYGQVDSNSIAHINSAKKRFFKEACDEIARHGISLKELDKVVFVGGTTNHLLNEITSTLPNHVIANNAQWTNCEGFFAVAVKKYGNLK